MERKRIKIGKPVVLNEGETSILRAVINDDGFEKILDYRVDKEYGQYLTWERSDTFVTVLLYYAMVKDKDIEWETPCSKQLIYQLQEYFIPVYDYEYNFMHKIELIGPTTDELLLSENGVATGLSNGVDSSYAVYKYLNYEMPEYKLTHVFFTDWYTSSYPQGYREDFLKNYLRVLPQCSNELGVAFVYISFNIDELFSIGMIVDDKCGTVVDTGLYALKYCSMAMALQKLLRVYYFSSTYAPFEFSFFKNDFAYHDIFTLPLISTSNLSFYSVGMEMNRFDKEMVISEFPYTYKHLQVCANSNERNCGHCEKCIRTMCGLYACGKLDLYKDVFPIDDFKTHYSKRIAFVLAKSHTGSCFGKEIIEGFKQNRISIPFSSYMLFPFYAIYEIAREHLRTKSWARKLFWKLHLDKVFHKNLTWNLSEKMDELVLGDDDK